MLLFDIWEYGKILNAGVLQEESDIPFEEDILRNPYSVKAWWRYLEHKRTAPRAVRNMVYERALKEIPGSYKIW